jgi:hypothetical protein
MPGRLDDNKAMLYIKSGFYYVDAKGLAWDIDEVDFYSFHWNRLITAYNLLRKASKNAADAKPLALVLQAGDMRTPLSHMRTPSLQEKDSAALA